MRLTGLPRSAMVRWLAIVSLLLALAVVAPNASSGKTSPRRPLLTVRVSGQGKVTSKPKGIACRTKCRRRFPIRASVKLVAKPSAKWSFWKWNGPCAKRKAPKCTVRMSAIRSVKAVFRLTIEIRPTPHSPRTLSPDAAKVLAYLGRLSNDTAPGVIVGQNCGPWWRFICDAAHYQEAIGKLHDQSGKWPGILSLAYEDWIPNTFDELSGANRRLTIPHWQAGGLMMISAAPLNPWVTDPMNPIYEDTSSKYPGTDLDALLPRGSKRGRWLAMLNRLARPLAELRDAGVVVLWRPMQEMNDTYFWWSKKDRRDKHEAYVRVWRDMFDYFTTVKGLNNLLWVFAPGGNPRSESSWPYPGDAYVDVVAPTTYNNDLSMPTYLEALSYGKPIGISEYGPSAVSSDLGADGSFDDRKYIERLNHDYPRVAFFVAWSSWEGVKMSLADNLYANELMNNPGVLTRDKIAWR